MRWAKLAALFLALAAAHAPVQAAWTEARTTHFIVLANDDAESVRDIARRLERFDAGMRRLHQLGDEDGAGANPLTVYILPTMDAVQDIHRFGRSYGSSYVAGFYSGRAAGSVAFTSRMKTDRSPLALSSETVPFHEYSHHLMLANFSGAYPRWFTEGFAEFNSTAKLEPETVGFGAPANHRMILLLLENPLPINMLLAGETRLRTMDAVLQVYARGWLLTHYLTFEPSRAGQLKAYLDALSAGKPSLQAATKAFGDLDRLNRDMNAYVRRRTLRYAVLSVPPVPEKAVTVRVLGAGEAAMMPVRMRLTQSVAKPIAVKLAQDAQKRAAPFPEDPAVQTLLAEAEYKAGEDDAAEAAADRALKADPADRKAMLWKGQVLTRRAIAAHATPAVFAKARNWFVKANRAMPDDPAPLLSFYQAYRAAGMTPPANAVTGLERALELAPQDDDLRMLLTFQMVRDGRLAEAKTVLAPLAFSPHRPPDNPAALLHAQIETGIATGAPVTLPDEPPALD